MQVKSTSTFAPNNKMKKLSPLIFCLAILIAPFYSFAAKDGSLKETIEFAEQGDAEEQFKLGEIYYYGKGIPSNFEEAEKWYRKSAEQGNAKAQFWLGWMCRYGIGTPQDYVMAHMWFNLSAAQGNAKAEKNRDIMAEKMTSVQVAEAQKLAREWKTKK